MGWKEWRYELEKANREYDCGMIDREIYESRVSFAIYMIYKCGNEDAARGMCLSLFFQVFLCLQSTQQQWLVYHLSQSVHLLILYHQY